MRVERERDERCGGWLRCVDGRLFDLAFIRFRLLKRGVMCKKNI